MLSGKLFLHLLICKSIQQGTPNLIRPSSLQGPDLVYMLNSCHVLKLMFTQSKVKQKSHTDMCQHDGIKKKKKYKEQELLSWCPGKVAKLSA